MSTRILTAAALAAAASSAALADGLDVWVSFADGQIVTGSADKSTNPVTFTSGVRVFEAEFGEVGAPAE